MFRHTVRVLLVSFAVPAMATAAAAEDGATARYIMVEGSGEAQAVPDMARLSAGVVTRGHSAREAMAGNAEAMGRVMGALRAAGIADRQVRTDRLSVTPVYDHSRTRAEPRAPIAYQATNTVEVTVNDLGHIGSLIDALVNSGANQLQGVQFGIRDAGPLEDKARLAAVADARRKAALYAEAAGVTLGSVLRIEERGAQLPGPRMMAAARMVQDTAVAPGEQTIGVALAVRFAIQ